MSRTEVIRELVLPLPWLAASIGCAELGLYLLALPLSFIFFLAGLRLVHGACHAAIGLPWRATRLVLFACSVVMLGSMHVVRWNHLRHHRHCLAPDDVEAMGARCSAWGAIMLGPRFPLRLHRVALANAAQTERRWILPELAGNVLLIGLVVAALPYRGLIYHVAAMLAGQCLTAFFAVWTVHHDCTGTPAARTIRGHLRSLLTFNMFFHVEHHLFPQVPTPHLPALARRLDAAFPRAGWARVW